METCTPMAAWRQGTHPSCMETGIAILPCDGTGTRLVHKRYCHEVVLGHSMGRYRCFCVIRRQYWILKAFRQVSKLHHRAALRDGTKVSMCGSPAT